jgi:hypothetical protein
MKRVVLSLAILALVGTNAHATSHQNQGTVAVNLGTADNFAVLAGSGITNVSAGTRIAGDVGSAPTPSVTGLLQSQVDGVLYLSSDPETTQAQADLTTGYNDAAGAPCGSDLTGIDLGGLTLVPGVYCFSSSAQLTGTLTLDAQGNTKSQWIFQIGSTLTTASDSKVLISYYGDNQQPHAIRKCARGCGVYWQIGSSATIGAGTQFAGIMMANTSITLNGGVDLGKALALNGAVTISDQEKIEGAPCDNGTPGHSGR